MFLPTHQRYAARLKWLSTMLMLALAGATIGTLWMGYELKTEQEAISRLLQSQAEDQIDTLAPFPEELKWQLAISLLLILVLISSFILVFVIMRGYLNSQRSLRDLSRQSNDILESMEQGVVTGNPSGSLISMNRRAQQILGIQRSESQIAYEDLDGATGLRLAEMAGEMLHTQEALEDRKVHFSLNGHPTHLIINGHLLRDEQGDIQGTVLHIRDVTERFYIEERMHRMEGYMGLGPVAAGLQHEIKNPLGALSLHVQLLAEKLSGHPDREVNEEIHILLTEIRRIGDVLERFNDYAHAQVLQLSEIRPVEILRRAVQLILPQATQKGIDLELKVGQWDGYMQLDVPKIEQVLINLLLNAIQAMNLPGRVQISLTLQRDKLVVEVADQGPGVSSVAREHMFDPYFTTRKDGLGMGLAVSRKIARLHGGELDFRNLQRGASFRLILPLNQHANSRV